jgi:hypothetical protein
LPPPPPENREGHYDRQPPSCLIFWILSIRIPNTKRHILLRWHYVAGLWRCRIALLVTPMTTHATLSRFCQAKSRIITIHATGRSLLGYLEGRLLRGRTIRVSQTVGGGSFDGVVLLSGLLLSGLLVRRLSHFQQMISPPRGARRT